MKVQFILLLLSVSCLALAVPALSNDSINDSSQEMHNEDHSLTMRSPNEAHAVSIHLENRALTCGERNGKFIRVIKDTTAQCVSCRSHDEVQQTPYHHRTSRTGSLSRYQRCIDQRCHWGSRTHLHSHYRSSCPGCPGSCPKQHSNEPY